VGRYLSYAQVGADLTVVGARGTVQALAIAKPGIYTVPVFCHQIYEAPDMIRVLIFAVPWVGRRYVWNKAVKSTPKGVKWNRHSPTGPYHSKVCPYLRVGEIPAHIEALPLRFAPPCNS